MNVEDAYKELVKKSTTRDLKEEWDK